jgi:hypothetical protein
LYKQLVWGATEQVLILYEPSDHVKQARHGTYTNCARTQQLDMSWNQIFNSQYTAEITSFSSSKNNQLYLQKYEHINSPIINTTQPKLWYGHPMVDLGFVGDLWSTVREYQ